VVSRPPVPDRAIVHRALAELEYLRLEASPVELAERMKAMAAGPKRPQPELSRHDSATIHRTST
jgi:hypothetical protein